MKKTITASDKTDKASGVESFRLHETDTGSPQVQVTLITARINQLAAHLQQHKKDVSSRQGLLKMVSHRRGLLEYIKRNDEDAYRKLLDALSLRK
jgi:small subunit ribosomal protein S15